MGESAKLDQILSTLTIMSTDMAVMNAVLTGIQGDGGIVADIKNIGEKMHKQGNSLAELSVKVDVSGNDIKHLTDGVKEHDDKIKTLFINSNDDRVAAAGVATKVAAGVTVVGLGLGAIIQYLMK